MLRLDEHETRITHEVNLLQYLQSSLKLQTVTISHQTITINKSSTVSTSNTQYHLCKVLLQLCKASLLAAPEGAQQVGVMLYTALLSVKPLFSNNKATGSELSETLACPETLNAL